jgi:hypothetical protein
MFRGRRIIRKKKKIELPSHSTQQRLCGSAPFGRYTQIALRATSHSRETLYEIPNPLKKPKHFNKIEK